MQYGDRVRVRKKPNIEFTIHRQQFAKFGREIETHSPMTGEVMPLTEWYEEYELEVLK